MKALLAGIALLAAVTAYRAAQAQDSNTQKTASDLAVEAREVGNRIVNKAYATCGKSRFSYGPRLRASAGHLMFDGYEVHLDEAPFWEFKGVTVEIKAAPVSPVDKLNGIQWTGEAIVRAVAVRGRLRGPLSSHEKAWSDWEKPNDDHNYFLKKNDRWYRFFDVAVPGGSGRTEPIEAILASIPTPSCSAVSSSGNQNVEE